MKKNKRANIRNTDKFGEPTWKYLLCWSLSFWTYIMGFIYCLMVLTTNTVICVKFEILELDFDIHQICLNVNRSIIVLIIWRRLYLLIFHSIKCCRFLTPAVNLLRYVSWRRKVNLQCHHRLFRELECNRFLEMLIFSTATVKKLKINQRVFFLFCSSCIMNFKIFEHYSKKTSWYVRAINYMTRYITEKTDWNYFGLAKCR